MKIPVKNPENLHSFSTLKYLSLFVKREHTSPFTWPRCLSTPHPLHPYLLPDAGHLGGNLPDPVHGDGQTLNQVGHNAHLKQ